MHLWSDFWELAALRRPGWIYVTLLSIIWSFVGFPGGVSDQEPAGQVEVDMG